jgi:hypothetical protein
VEVSFIGEGNQGIFHKSLTKNIIKWLRIVSEGHYNIPSLIRPLLPKATPLIRLDFR